MNKLVSMRGASPLAVTAAALVLCLASSGCTQKQTPPAAESAAATPAGARGVSPGPDKLVVEPDAVKAIQRMSAYLRRSTPSSWRPTPASIW